MCILNWVFCRWYNLPLPPGFYCCITKRGRDRWWQRQLKASLYSCWSWRRQRNSRKTFTAASLTMLKPLTMWNTTNWKILSEMEVPDNLTYLLRNLCAGQEATVRTEHGTMDWFKIGKGVWQGCILSPCLFNLCAEYIMQNAGLKESQAGIKIKTSYMQMIPL